MATEKHHYGGDGDTRSSAQFPLGSPQHVDVRPILTNSEAYAVAYNKLLMQQSRSVVRSPFPPVRRKHTLAVLDAMDTVDQDEQAQAATPQTETAQLLTARLVEPRAALRAETPNWTPARRRHEVITAVSSAQALDRSGFYLDLLLNRTGLSREDVAKIRENVPEWRETVEVLTEDQKFAAEAVCSRLLLEQCRQTATEMTEDHDASTAMQVTVRLLKAHVRIQQNIEGTTDEDQVYADKARSMMPELEAGRNKIFDKAQLWTERDMHRKVKAAHREFRRLETPELLQEITGITSDTIDEARKTGRVELLVTSALAVGNELLSHAPGIAVSQVNLQEYITDNPWILGGATTILYGALVGAMVKTSFTSADLLTKTGVSLDPWSKLKYDYAVDDEKKKALFGALKYHGAWEVPFYGVALAIGAKYGWEAGLAYFNTASVAGIVKNGVLNGGVEVFHMGKNAYQRRKDMREMNSFLPTK